MRVAHVSCYVDAAGRSPAALLDAWPTLVDVAAAIAAAGVEVTVLQAAVEDATLERCGVRFRFVHERAPHRLQRRLGHWATPLRQRLIEELRRLAPDIVHLHSLSYPRHAAHIRRALPRVRLIIQDHSDFPPGRAWLRPVHRRGLAAADAVLFTALEQADPFRAAGLLPAHVRVFAVPESSTRVSPGDREAARAVTGLHGDPCLLWLGHLNENKDPLTILDAVDSAAAELPALQLWMCYRTAPLLAQVEQRIRSSERLRTRVHLLGEQPPDRVELMLRAADFLVQGSHNEGSGYAILEAMACGTAPLVTDIPPFRALTGGGRAGALFPTGRPDVLRDALVRLAREPRDRLRQRVRSHFEQELSWPMLGQKLRAIYSEVLER